MAEAKQVNVRIDRSWFFPTKLRPELFTSQFNLKELCIDYREAANQAEQIKSVH